MQPFNYSIDTPDIQDSFLKGVQQNFALQDRQNAQQAQQQQQMQQMQMQRELNELANNPNPIAKDYARVATKYPQLSEKLKHVWEPLDAEQKQNRISQSTQVFAALKSGNSELAADLLNNQAEAARNSGDDRQAGLLEGLVKTIAINPKAVADATALTLSQAMGPEKFASVYDSLTKTPVEAEKLAQESANLPTKQRLENENLFQDVETKRLKRQLDVFDSQIKSEDSETKRGQLQVERDKLANEFNLKKQEKQIEAQNSLDTITQSLATIKKVAESPMLKGGVGGVGSWWRGVAAKLPGSEARDFDNLLETARSEQFTSAISQMKGMGALSDAEGKKIEKAVASLDPDQSVAAFKTAANTIKSTLERAQAKIIGRGNLPTGESGGGAAFVMNHPKYGKITDAVVNSLLEQKPGMTREQALQFFKATGGQ